MLLHEGLGSAGMWGDFPEKLSAATGCGVFAWSRVGYGQSSPAKLPRTLDFMHVEARADSAAPARCRSAFARDC